MGFHYVTRPSVTINGHLSRSLDWIITNNVTGNFLVCAFWCIYVHVFQGLYLGAQWLGIGYVHLEIQDMSVSHVVAPLYSPGHNVGGCPHTTS